MILTSKPWHTWAAHGTVAVLITTTIALFGVSPYLAATYGPWYYLLREIEQVGKKISKKQELNPLDHFMDVASPTATAFLTAFLISKFF